MALPREMRPGAHTLNGGAVVYNDDTELVAAKRPFRGLSAIKIRFRGS